VADETVDVKLARIEVQLNTLIDKFDHFDDLITKLATKEELVQLEVRFEKKVSSFVSKDEFSPVKLIAFGLVGFILIAVLGAIVNLTIVG
jgi:hypothetical protein